MKYFSILIKPASSLCNMRCKYCFYADVADNRQVPSYGVMQEETAKALIDRVFDYLQPPATVSFAFQGGEPTLAGLEFFRRFTEYAAQRANGRYELQYSIQTNGLLIDEDWCSLFSQYRFLVGISLDAEPSIHDFCRVDAQGKGTWNRVRQAIRLLDHAGVPYNVLSVITKQMAQHPQKVFAAYRKNNIGFVQLIPCLQPLEGGTPGPYDLTPRLYAAFLKQFFVLWYNSLRAGYYISVRQFDNLVRMLQGHPPEQCGMMGRCTPQFVVEADGGVYPCDFYVLDQYRCGNILTQDVESIARSGAMADFVQQTPPPGPLCAACRVKGLCGGGCKRYRAFYNQEAGYCPYQDFLYASVDQLADVARMV
ncbi:MAG TPA: SPASM domain-containing protein [Candidatus Gallacutalibacter stercoravium]|nr:SPASM domain-containing protein [Candidatus Gallacutalibacter stercoravium]